MELNKSTMMIIGWLVAMIVGLLILCYIQFKKDSLDLRYLILDDVTGKPSLSKLGQLIALVMSSWGFQYQILNDRMTEWYFGLYMSAWAVTGLANKWLSGKQNLTQDGRGNS
jgi:hypothetical protein